MFLEIGSSVHRLAAAAWSTHKHFTDTPAVQFRKSLGSKQESAVVALPGRDSQASASVPVSRRDQQEHHETFSDVCLSQRSEDQLWLKTHKRCTASCTSKPNSVSITVHRGLFIPSTHHVSSTGLSKWLCLSWRHSASQPKSKESSRNCSTPPEIFWWVSLYGVPTNSTTQCQVDQYMRAVSKVILHHVSFHVLALAEHPFTCFCFSQTFLHESALAFHACVHFKETFLLMIAPAKLHPTSFPKNP